MWSEGNSYSARLRLDLGGATEDDLEEEGVGGGGGEESESGR